MPIADVFYNTGSKWVGPGSAVVVPPPVDAGGWDSRVRKPPTEAELPYPVYDIEALRQGTDTTISAVAARIPTTGGYLRFPAGVYPLKVGQSLTYPGEFHPKMLGWIGQYNGKPGGNTILQISDNPTDAYLNTSFRFGHESHGENNMGFMQDITVQGARRAYTGTNPVHSPVDAGAALYSGLFLYRTINTYINRVKWQGLGYGGGGAPETGESSMLTNWRSPGTVITDSDIDGRLPDGTRVSSGIGGGGDGAGLVMYRTHFHDTAVSGMSNTFTGDPAGVNSPGGDVYVIDCKIGNIANWHNGLPGGAGRYGFTIIGNHEAIKGTVVFDRVQGYHDLIDNAGAGGPLGLKATPDFTFDTFYKDQDTAPILIRDCVTRGRPTPVICMDYTYGTQRNQQRTLPTVIRDGKTLQPYFWTGASSFDAVNDMRGLDVANQYVLFWRGAPASSSRPTVPFPNL